VGVFSVTTGVTFTVQNLTIANGTTSGNGGGIYNQGGTLTVSNSTFSDNSAHDVFGGGAIANAGTLTVTNSTFSDNSAHGAGDGGAILNFNFSTLTVTNSTFSGNSAHGNTVNGGGIGGGIFNFGTLTVANSTFSGNSADGAGGGIDNGGTLTVTNSTFSGNSADGNTVNGGTGGGIFNEHSGTLTVTNSTFSGNSANGAGGGIDNESATLTVTNCTFSGNTASPGGSIDNHGGGVVLLRNTIVADSTDGGNCSGHITDGGHNLDDGTTCVFSAAKGSLSNTNPQLDPAGLQSSGGLTQTVALCADVGVPAGCTTASPAIDAGDQAVCAAAPVNNRDQRGYVRPGASHTNCSIGAFEFNSPGPPSCDVGDCNDDGQVAIDELITLVNIALGNAQPSTCPYGVPSGAEVNVALIIQAVNAALNGCLLTPEQGCLASGGTVTSALCCASTADFPDTCAVGACGCAPNASHAVRACTCGAEKCFDGSACVSP
jgi:hypothetical protein